MYPSRHDPRIWRCNPAEKPTCWIFADIISINKLTNGVPQMPWGDVGKQVQRNKQLWDKSPEKRVYGTISGNGPVRHQFALQKLMQLICERTNEFQSTIDFTSWGFRENSHHSPGRTRYLSEIADTTAIMMKMMNQQSAYAELANTSPGDTNGWRPGNTEQDRSN